MVVVVLLAAGLADKDSRSPHLPDPCGGKKHKHSGCIGLDSQGRRPPLFYEPSVSSFPAACLLPDYATLGKQRRGRKGRRLPGSSGAKSPKPASPQSPTPPARALCQPQAPSKARHLGGACSLYGGKTVCLHCFLFSLSPRCYLLTWAYPHVAQSAEFNSPVGFEFFFLSIQRFQACYSKLGSGPAAVKPEPRYTGLLTMGRLTSVGAAQLSPLLPRLVLARNRIGGYAATEL